MSIYFASQNSSNVATQLRRTVISTQKINGWQIVVIVVALLVFLVVVYQIVSRLIQMWRYQRQEFDGCTKERYEDHTENSSLNSCSFNKSYNIFESRQSSEEASTLSYSSEILLQAPKAALQRNQKCEMSVSSMVNRGFEGIKDDKKLLNASSMSEISIKSAEKAAENFLLTNFSGNSRCVVPLSLRPRSQSMERFTIVTEDINPALYSNHDEVCTEELQCHGLGRICFSVQVEQQQQLNITIHRAANLFSRKITNGSHFYIKMTLYSSTVISGCNMESCTREVKCMRNPVFEERFSFHVNPNEMCMYTLKMWVMEKLSSNKRETIGIVTFPMSQLKMELQATTKLNQSSISTSADDESVDHVEQLQQEFSFRELWREIEVCDQIQSKCKDITCGQLYISLCYHPLRKKLTVGILECKELVLQEGSAVHVRIALQTDERVLKTKRSKTVRQRVENPQFKQSFEFNLSDILLTPTAINSTSKTPTPTQGDAVTELLENICLAFYVCVTRRHRLQSKWRTLSKCVAGPVKFAENMGLLHWKDMISTPKATIYNWHCLH